MRRWRRVTAWMISCALCAAVTLPVRAAAERPPRLVNTIALDWDYDLVEDAGRTDGRAVAGRGGKFGLLDRTGRELIPVKYDDAATLPAGHEGGTSVSDGLTVTRLPGGADAAKFTLADKSGKDVLPRAYDSVTSAWDGVAYARDESGIWYLLVFDTCPYAEPSDWAAGEAERARELSLLPGALQIAYTRPITRGEFCALAVRLIEAVTGEEIETRRVFSDVYGDANVEKIGGLGIIEGSGDGSFSPGKGLTREQAAAILSRLMTVVGSPAGDGPVPFADRADISSWALGAVGRLYQCGIMRGGADNTFAPGGSFTREQSILTVLRLYDYLTETT